MTETFAIIGAGFGGICTAIGLQRLGRKVVIYERNPRPIPINAGLVLGANAIQALDHLGLADKILKHGIQRDTCSIYGDDGTLLTTLRGSSLPYSAYTFMTRDVLAGMLEDELLPGTIHYGRNLVDFQENTDNTLLFFDDGAMETCTWLIAADGIHSAVRRQLVPKQQPIHSGTVCWRGIIENCPEYLISEYSETWGPHGKIGFMPLPGSSLCWYVFKNSSLGQREYARWTADDLLANFYFYHGMIPHILERADQDNIHHHELYQIPPLSRYHYGRTLLIGDAAHAAFPSMGQGACQTIEDAMYLTQALLEAPAPKEAFSRYEKQRLNDTRQFIEDAHKLGILSQTDIPQVCTLRNEQMQTSSYYQETMSAFLNRPVCILK